MFKVCLSLVAIYIYDGKESTLNLKFLLKLFLCSMLIGCFNCDTTNNIGIDKAPECSRCYAGECISSNAWQSMV